LLICVILPLQLLAQEENTPAQAPFVEEANPELFRKSQKYALHYERLVFSALQKYFNSGSFVVDARVMLDEMVVPVRERVSPAGSPTMGSLPGLPVSPSELQPAGDGSLETQPEFRITEYRKDFGIRYVDLRIMVDSAYTVEDFRFIMELVRMAADLDEARGDRIRISKAPFPGGEKKEHRLVAPEQRADSLQRDEDNAPEFRTVTFWESIQGSASFILILLLVFLFLLLLLWMVMRFLKTTQEQRGERERNIETLMMEIRQLKEETLAQLPGPSLPGDAEEEQKLLRVSVMEGFIGTPKEASLVAENWIQSLEDKGISRVARLVALTDEGLMNSMGAILPSTELKKIRYHLNSVIPDEDMDVTDQNDILREFLKDLRNRLGDMDGDSRQGDIFNFLRTLSLYQLSHILNDQPPGIQGVALAQVDPQMAARILQKMPGDLRSETLISMGKIQTVSIQSYKEIARLLARKALEVANMRFVAADGVESIIDVIQDMPLDAQKEHLESITQKDLELAEKIRRYYIPFEDLVQLPDALLLDMLQDLDRQVLVLALQNTTIEFRGSVLSVFPERMQRMVESSLNSLGEVTHEDIEKARRRLLGHVRIHLREMGGLPE